MDEKIGLMSRKLQLIELAKLYLRGEDITSKISYSDLYEELIQYDQFGYATEISLLQIEEQENKGQKIDLKRYQDLARNVYKDTTLSSYFKFDKALSILKTHCSLEENSTCETLGLAGAIFKNKWRFDHQFKHLLESRAYYKKGYNIWKKDINEANDCGYTAINYAFINELIVVENLEQISIITGITDEILRRFKTSQKVRKQIIETYVKETDAVSIKFQKDIKVNEWIYATLAEAYFGIRKYDMALFCINQYTKSKNAYWQIKSFTEQMYELASFQIIEKKYDELNQSNYFESKSIDEAKQKECLLALDLERDKTGKNKSKNPREYESRKKGKLGIGLSGGGYRAALFHIGVLAGLAEKNKLKDLEVISCVSGGSIIGTHYYLKLKNLLEQKPDEEITQDDYINLVKELEVEHLKAVQKNMRVMLFSNPLKNIKMLQNKKYSRTHRIGELYEELLYLPVVNCNLKKGAPKIKSINMSDLKIKPFGETDFNIYSDNWKRKNKIPQLILNATTLNTGHNWQFTATWMGEPPTYISDDLDVKPRLRRMYYENAPDKYKEFRLGYAVAASSGVPALFEPLLLNGLYEDFDLELVDGGVHDNQGIASILQEECHNIIISDGSSQMTNKNTEFGNELSVFFRSDSILQERVREIQLLDLKSRSYTSMINSLIIVHLKNGLSQSPISWKDCTDMERKILGKTKCTQQNTLLYYGIMNHIQKLISEIRTDLDAHNDMEAFALMYSGYQQIMHDHPVLSTAKLNNWKFIAIEKSCTSPNMDDPLIKQLEVSPSVFLKIIKLSKIIRVLYFLFVIGIVAIMAYLLYQNWDYCIDKIITLIGATLITILVGYISKIAVPFWNPIGYLKKKIFWIAIVIFGSIATNFYLLTFNKIYNYLGRVK